MKKILKEVLKDNEIKYFGITDIGPYKDLEKILVNRYKNGYLTNFEERDITKRIDPKQTMENVKSIIVCLFPYYVGEFADSNISKYTYGLDYHIYIKDKLDEIGHILKRKILNFEFMSFADNGPLVDRYLAYKAGLGFYGINSNLINEEYGSYFFIGYILNNYPFVSDEPQNRTCLQCFECIKNCPGNIILGNYQINPLRCKSYLTQKKDELNLDEKTIIKATDLVFGCDICQEVCPHNKYINKTEIKEFKNNIITKLDYNEIERLSNKEFIRKYKNRAFSWRGRKIIKRNFDIIKGEVD